MECSHVTMKKHKYAGFTLLEMLLVLSIIAVLVLLFIPNILSHQKGIDQKSTEAFRKSIETQVSLYYLEHGTYPKALSDLSLTPEQLKKAEDLVPPVDLTPDLP